MDKDHIIALRVNDNGAAGYVDKDVILVNINNKKQIPLTPFIWGFSYSDMGGYAYTDREILKYDFLHPSSDNPMLLFNSNGNTISGLEWIIKDQLSFYMDDSGIEKNRFMIIKKEVYYFQKK